mmetsp:Transcript_1410/g.3967  ORF Transcript_1410/g.3967 Transcript_1410/m.3967 type:complete len:636 (+) Transcript_1410:118-2025(+)
MSVHRATSSEIRHSGEGDWINLRHHENVYSYFKFIIPVEDKKTNGHLTYTKALAWFLVVVSIVVQSTLLYAIFDRVVKGDIKWQNKILNPHGESFGVSPGGGSRSFFFPEGPKCNPGGSLCFKLNGTVSCAPPSVQLTGRWDELDTDGDGVWTREEVMASKEALHCKYAVNPVEVFDVFVQLLKDREDVLWLHPDVKARKAIPKAYFTYAAGDIIMCGYRSTDMCANILKMGAFEAPLKYGTAPRVGKTIDSALDYCFNLLKVGGTCERTLPSTYAVWRKNGEEQCGDPDFDKFVYSHPVDGTEKSMLTVDYEARKAYQRAQGSNLFLTYKAIVVGLFLLAMFNEFKACMALFNWIIMFPSAKEFGEDAVLAETDEESDEVKYTVQGITTFHRAVCCCLAFCRIAMLSILVWVGLSFLLKDTTYIDLLLNAVGFVFVMEIAEYFYLFVVDADLRDECDNITFEKVQQLGPGFLTKHPALRNILSLFLLIALTTGVMYAHHAMIVTPLGQALECTCLGKGAGCLEAQKFTPEFWSNYWRYEVPAVFQDVAQMKRAHEAGEKGFRLGDVNDRDERGALKGYAAAPAYAAAAPAPMPRRRPHKRVVHRKHDRRSSHSEPMLSAIDHGYDPLWSAPRPA